MQLSVYVPVVFTTTFSEPLAGGDLVPLQAPEAVQLVGVFVAVQENETVLPAVTEIGPSDVLALRSVTGGGTYGLRAIKNDVMRATADKVEEADMEVVSAL